MTGSGLMNLNDLPKGTLLKVRRKPGKYSFQYLSTTQAGRTVVNLVGPVGTGREAFHACYAEDVQG